MKDILTMVAEHFILEGICETLDTNYYVSKEDIVDYVIKLQNDKVLDFMFKAPEYASSTSRLWHEIRDDLVSIMKTFVPVADVISVDKGIAIYYYTGYVDYEEDE